MLCNSEMSITGFLRLLDIKCSVGRVSARATGSGSFVFLDSIGHAKETTYYKLTPINLHK